MRKKPGKSSSGNYASWAVQNLNVPEWINFPEVPFIAVSHLNILRRETIEKLIQAWRQNRHIETRIATRSNVQFPEKELFFNANVLNHKAAEFLSQAWSKND